MEKFIPACRHKLSLVGTLSLRCTYLLQALSNQETCRSYGLEVKFNLQSPLYDIVPAPIISTCIFVFSYGPIESFFAKLI